MFTSSHHKKLIDENNTLLNQLLINLNELLILNITNLINIHESHNLYLSNEAERFELDNIEILRAEKTQTDRIESDWDYSEHNDAKWSESEWIDAVNTATENAHKNINLSSNTDYKHFNKGKRTYSRFNIDPDNAEWFKVGDKCARCGHIFKRRMIKEFHYTSSNCINNKPYSETTIGKRGKKGEHALRKARKAAKERKGANLVTD